MSPKNTFNRVLGSKDVVSLAFGAAIGWGWVVLSGKWIQTAGTLGAILAFLLGGVVISFVGFAYAELTPALPLCGGEHIFSLRALGPTASFICTWALILGYISVVAFETCALPSVIEYIFPNFLKGYLYEVAGFKIYATWLALSIASTILITTINYLGVKPTAFLQGLLTLAILIVGVVLMLGALKSGSLANIQPLFRNGSSGVISVTVMTPFMLVGFDVIPQAAEEINIPYRRIGGLILFSIVLAVLWYIGIIIAVSLLMTDANMSSSGLVTADAMKKAFGGSNLAANILVLGGVAGILSSWNAFMVGGSRAIFAMAKSGMLPSFLGKLHPKYNTPHNAILLIGVLSCIAPLLGKGMLTWLSNAGSLAVIVAYSFVVASFLALRKNEPNLKRPYKVRNGLLLGRIAFVLSCGLIFLYMPGMPSGLSWPYEWGIILLWSLVGGVFFLLSRPKMKTLKENMLNMEIPPE